MNENGQAKDEDVTVTTGRDQRNWLLDGLVQRVAGAEQAIALSGDGLLLARSTVMNRDDAEHLAAMASAFQSLSRAVGSEFGKGAVRQSVVELEYGYLVVTEAGEGACLALLASVDADLGMVAYEMNVTVQQVGSSLSVNPRSLPAELPRRTP
jgi:predicted regulator of Ras-like GTPase activity (Roadblock/LC7/MglB family)